MSNKDVVRELRNLARAAEEGGDIALAKLHAAIEPATVLMLIADLQGAEFASDSHLHTVEAQARIIASTAQQAAESVDTPEFRRLFETASSMQFCDTGELAALVAHINAWGRPATSHEGKVEGVPTGWRDVIAEARDGICAGGLAENAAYERRIVEPHLDGIYDELEALERAAAPERSAPLYIQDADKVGGLSSAILECMYKAFQRGDSVERVHAAVMALIGSAAPECSETPADERTRHFEEQPDGTIHDIEPTVSSSAAPSDERAAFVAWGQAGHTFLDDERNDAGVYVSSSTRLAWMAWQARARTTPSVQAVAAPGQEQAAGNSDSLANWLRNQIGAGPVTMTRGDAFALVNALDSYQAALVEWTKPAASPVELTDADDEARIMEMELALYRDAYGAKAPSEALVDVIDERQRQVSVKDWSHEHDDAHPNGEIAAFAAVYAMPPATRDWLCVAHMGYGDTLGEALCPEGWTPNFGERRRELVKAGALILAEIERLDRASHLSGDTAAQGGE